MPLVLRVLDVLGNSKKSLMQDFDFFLDCLEGPECLKVAAFNKHETAKLSIGLSLWLHVLEDVDLEVGMAE
jgi:hypothetical protein